MEGISYPLIESVQKATGGSGQSLHHLMGHKVHNGLECVSILFGNPVSLKPRPQSNMDPIGTQSSRISRSCVSVMMIVLAVASCEGRMGVCTYLF